VHSRDKVSVDHKYISNPVKGEVNFPCDGIKNWSSIKIPFVNRKEVGIEGFDGADHHFDLLEEIFRCAPVLKRMVMRMSDEITICTDRCTQHLQGLPACGMKVNAMLILVLVSKFCMNVLHAFRCNYYFSFGQFR
jgi:hypothetical protein